MKTNYLLAVLALSLFVPSSEAQFLRRPFVPVRPNVPYRPGYIDTSWQNNPYVYWEIHHHRPYPPIPPYPYPYPVPVGYSVVNNYYAPDPGSNVPQQTTTVLPPPSPTQGVVVIKLPTTAAVVWIDGNKIESGLNATRVYTTPELEPGHDYRYLVKA